MKQAEQHPPLGVILRQQLEAYRQKTGQPDLRVDKSELMGIIDRALSDFADSLKTRLVFAGVLLRIEEFREEGDVADPTLQSLPKGLPKNIRAYAWDKLQTWAQEYDAQELPHFLDSLRAEFPVNDHGDYDLCRMRSRETGFFGNRVEFELDGFSLEAWELGNLPGMQKLDEICDEHEVFYSIEGLGFGQARVSIRIDCTREFEHHVEVFPPSAAPVPSQELRDFIDAGTRRKTELFMQAAENRKPAVTTLTPEPPAEKENKPRRNYLRLVK